MSVWTKRNPSVMDFITYVLETTRGKTPGMILAERDPARVYGCPGIALAAQRLRNAQESGKTVCGVFDYDADGICSAAEAHLLLKELGIRHTVTIPRRMSDGYGVSPDIISRLPDGAMLLTVDNGITANEAVAAAKAKGMEVVILDHHNAKFKDGLDVPSLAEAADGVTDPAWFDLPDADLIVDPEALLLDHDTPLPTGWDYGHYCGAGLVYLLARDMCADKPEFLDKLATFAAIATVGDSVDVTGENGRIIEHGLSCINHGKGTDGLRQLVSLVQKDQTMNPLTLETIGYYLAPLINAPGRLLDEGGKLVLSTLLASGVDALTGAQQIQELNEKRKALVADCFENAEVLGDKVAFVYDETVPEGICGIIAAKFCEKYHRPAFVMTLAENGKVKGSCRCEDGDSVLTLLRASGHTLTGFGGHDQAAGFSLTVDSVPHFLQALEDAAPEPSFDDVELYDLDVMPKDLMPLYQAQNGLFVFGQGLPVPVIRITAAVTDVRTMGKDKSHLSFKIANIKCVAFGMAEQYSQMGSPPVMTVYGTLGINWYNGGATPQISVKDFKVV